jgi:hypothetical protein
MFIIRQIETARYTALTPHLTKPVFQTTFYTLNITEGRKISHQLNPNFRYWRFELTDLDIPNLGKWLVIRYRIAPEAKVTASERRVIKKLNINRLNRTHLPTIT